MPITITLDDHRIQCLYSAADSAANDGGAAAVRELDNILVVIEVAAAALATAPIEGSGAHGVDDEPELDEIIDACREARKRVGARCPRCGRHDGHYDSCTYAPDNTFVTAIDRATGDPIPGHAYGLRGH